MTVRELIQNLSVLPPDIEVVLLEELVVAGGKASTVEREPSALLGNTSQGVKLILVPAGGRQYHLLQGIEDKNHPLLRAHLPQEQEPS